MIVVSNSSPLITLAKIGHFDMLGKLYDKIFITPEVFQEVVSDGGGLPGSIEVAAARWMIVACSQAGHTSVWRFFRTV